MEGDSDRQGSPGRRHPLPDAARDFRRAGHAQGGGGVVPGFLKKVYETPELKKYMEDGALKPAFATGAEYVKWVEEDEKLHRDLMTKGGLLKK